jgi:hypothetical protein
LNEHRSVHDVLVHEAGAAALLDVEGQAATREALSLFAHITEAFSADWYAEPA